MISIIRKVYLIVPLLLSPILLLAQVDSTGYYGQKQLESFGKTTSSLIENWLNTLGVNPSYSDELKFIIIILLLIIICYLADFITKRILLTVIKNLVRKTKSDWDDIMFEKKVFTNLSHLVPALILEALIPIFFDGYTGWIAFGLKISHAYMIFCIMWVLIALARTSEVVLSRHPMFKDKPTESYLQLTRLIIYSLSAIYLTSVLFDKSPWGIFSALGAMSVVLLLVFKDTILGFVASIQLSANNMVKLGDWVEFPKYGADGEVIEIKLQTIKISNWDKTITTIPTYAFVSDAFKNWRGMEESGGRRIKRSFFIDMSTIKFCDEEMLNRFRKIQYIQAYIDEKLTEINKFNEEKNADLSCIVNGRRMTNIGTLRAYITAYLKQHDKISKNMTFLVRQLQPTDKGLPIEIYVFSTDQRWAYYEGIQSDIFDHVLSIVKEFDLEIYQSPSGNDVKKLGAYLIQKPTE